MKDNKPALFSQIIFALRFFTRLPLPGDADHKGDLAQTHLAFPIAGLIIGGLVALVWAIAALVLPALAAAGIAIAAGVLLTGALHEDGLSDCADGLGGGHEHERALEIMRDSRIGAYGAAALIFSIGLRWACLASLGILSGVAVLLIAHLVSRSAITIALATATYARNQGLGSSVASGISVQDLMTVSAIALLLSALFGGISGLLAAIMAMGAAWLFLQYLERRIGGYSGDGLGGMQQIAEITVMLALAGSWGM